MALFDCAPLIPENTCKNKLQLSALKVIDQVIESIRTDIEKAYEISLPELSVQFYKAHESLQNLMSLIRDSYSKCSTTNEKVQLLTLIPDHWDFNEAQLYFNCSRYVFNAAKELKNEKGKFTIKY